MTRGNPTAFVRRMTRDDISAIVDLQSRVFAGMNPWKAEALARHLTIFPEGTGDHDDRPRAASILQHRKPQRFGTVDKETTT